MLTERAASAFGSALQLADLRSEIAAIDQDRSLAANSRLIIDAETVSRYAASIDKLPPVILYRVKGVLLVADGLHRLAAAQEADRETIEAEIIDTDDECKWREAILRSNHEHGRPWTRAERRGCVEEWLQFYPERSNAWIAADMGVSDHTVARVRVELEATSQIERLSELVGRDLLSRI